MPHEFQVAVKGVIVQKGRALVLRGQFTAGERAGEYVWDLPGGRMEKAESIETGLLRELKEELPGIQAPEVGSLLHAIAGRHLESNKDLILLFFSVSALLPEVRLSHEHVEYRWITAQEIETLEKETNTKFFPGFNTAIQRALQEF